MKNSSYCQKNSLQQIPFLLIKRTCQRQSWLNVQFYTTCFHCLLSCVSMQVASRFVCFAEIYTVSGFTKHTIQPQQFFGQKWPTRYKTSALHIVPSNTLSIPKPVCIHPERIFHRHFLCNVGYDMSTFIRRYSRYLNEKAVSYRQVAFDFTKVKRG